LEINKMIKNLTTDLLNDFKTKAKKSDRKRTHYNLHPELDDPVQRLVIAIEPGSYIRPHRHPEKGKWELFIVLKGAAVMLVFDEKGQVTDRLELSENGPNHAVEVPDLAWHTLAALEPGTILMEIKPGPYAPLADKDFASWAPAEGDEQAALFEERFRKCEVGEVFGGED
jgi:cupin fold WbuC family metalloprotein